MLLGASKGRGEREEAVTGLVLTHGPYQTAEYFQRASRLPRGADGNTPVCSEMGHTAHSRGNLKHLSYLSLTLACKKELLLVLEGTTRKHLF